MLRKPKMGERIDELEIQMKIVITTLQSLASRMQQHAQRMHHQLDRSNLDHFFHL